MMCNNINSVIIISQRSINVTGNDCDIYKARRFIFRINIILVNKMTTISGL